MFSFIVCSIKPEETKALEQNIAATVGVPYEYISFDNRKFQYGLTKVYNLCARKARYDYLCFLHEDVRFLSEGWGKEISAQLSKENCGVIGFAGSTVKLKSSTQWAVSKQTTRIHLIQQMRFGKEKQVENNPDKNDFSPVITLDGLCLFVKRSVWEQTPFDETTFTNFHCYDLDFSLSVAQRYTNYVCHTISIVHFSSGSYSPAWHQETKKLNDKWASRLPMSVTPMTAQEQVKLQKYSSFFSEFLQIKNSWRKGDFLHKNFSDAFALFQNNLFQTKAWELIFLSYPKYKLVARHSAKKAQPTPVIK